MFVFSRKQMFRSEHALGKALQSHCSALIFLLAGAPLRLSRPATLA
jgi:hypothetical protein